MDATPPHVGPTAPTRVHKWYRAQCMLGVLQGASFPPPDSPTASDSSKNSSAASIRSNSKYEKPQFRRTECHRRSLRGADDLVHGLGGAHRAWQHSQRRRPCAVRLAWQMSFASDLVPLPHSPGSASVRAAVTHHRHALGSSRAVLWYEASSAVAYGPRQSVMWPCESGIASQLP